MKLIAFLAAALLTSAANAAQPVPSADITAWGVDGTTTVILRNNSAKYTTKVSGESFELFLKPADVREVVLKPGANNIEINFVKKVINLPATAVAK